MKNSLYRNHDGLILSLAAVYLFVAWMLVVVTPFAMLTGMDNVAITIALSAIGGVLSGVLVVVLNHKSK